MLQSGEKVLVAVSGGVDSTVLMDILYGLAQEYGVDLAVAHLDHRLRGEESKEDACFVAQLAEQYGLSLISESIDVRAMATEKKVGIEEAARMVRMKFLRETADDIGAVRIAVGHTANDLAETMLFNLIRGAGTTGLAGIKPANPPFVRPLIDVTRAEIIAYAHEHGLSWREDRSNTDMSFTRNQIRHEIIPLLEVLNPNLIESLSRTAEIVREERDAFSELLEQPWKEVLSEKSEGMVRLDRAYLAMSPIGIRRALLRLGLKRVRGDLQGIGKVHIDALCNLIASARVHGELHLPRTLARVQGGDLILTVPHATQAPIAPCEVPMGKADFPSFGIALDLAIGPWEANIDSLKERSENVEISDADKVSFPLVLRMRLPGDRFSPLGLSGTKKLKDFLIDSRVPFYKRNLIPLLCDREGIMLVVGERLSNVVRVDENTRRVLIIRWKETT
jgi:tRNA(Ile)-lysidine synthase